MLFHLEGEAFSLGSANHTVLILTDLPFQDAQTLSADPVTDFFLFVLFLQSFADDSLTMRTDGNHNLTLTSAV